MTFDLFFAAVVAGMVYVLIPGPATLAVLTLSSTQGRKAAARFLLAHLAGDLLWSILALMAIVGVSNLGAGLFNALGVACGIYLIFLGWKALRAPPDAHAPIIKDPVKAGFAFGLMNPKAYPFAVAVLTTLVGTINAELSWGTAALLLAGCFVGFAIADIIVVFWTGIATVRQIFRVRSGLIGRLSGIVFMAFGVKSISDATLAWRTRP